MTDASDDRQKETSTDLRVFSPVMTLYDQDSKRTINVARSSGSHSPSLVFFGFVHLPGSSMPKATYHIQVLCSVLKYHMVFRCSFFAQLV